MNKPEISILGCGWLGLPLAKLLKAQGYAVKGSVSRQERLKEIQQTCDHTTVIDIRKELKSVDEFWNSDVLVITIPPFGDPEAYSRHIDLLAGFLKTKQYQQVIYTSSTSVYPNLNRVVTEQDASPAELSRSGISLFKIEHLLKSQVDQLTNIRFGGLFGPGRHPVKYLSGRKINGGDDPVNLIHQSDCLNIYLTLIQQKLTGKTFNACHPHHPTKYVFYTNAAEMLNIEPPHFDPQSKGYKEVSSAKLIEETGYQFGQTLQQT